MAEEEERYSGGMSVCRQAPLKMFEWRTAVTIKAKV